MQILQFIGPFHPPPQRGQRLFAVLHSLQVTDADLVLQGFDFPHQIVDLPRHIAKAVKNTVLMGLLDRCVHCVLPLMRNPHEKTRPTTRLPAKWRARLV